MTTKYLFENTEYNNRLRYKANETNVLPFQK